MDALRLVLASNNAKKLKELGALLAPAGVELVTQGALGVAEAEEPHHTFIENALAKARHAAAATGLAAIADDSGLCVDALNGAPGIYSARYGGVDSDQARYRLLLESIDKGVMLFDRHLGIISANPAAHRIFNLGSAAPARLS